MRCVLACAVLMSGSILGSTLAAQQTAPSSDSAGKVHQKPEFPLNIRYHPIRRILIRHIIISVGMLLWPRRGN